MKSIGKFWLRVNQSLNGYPGQVLNTLGVGKYLEQLYTRIAGGWTTVEVHDQRLKLNLANPLHRTIAHGEHEPWITTYLERTLNRGDVFFDIGSHIGYFSLIASELVSDSGQVYAFEAHPGNYSLLKQNIELNNRTNIVPEQYAVSDIPDAVVELHIDQTRDGQHSYIEASTKDSEKLDIPTTSLDAYCNQTGCGHPDVIKIDVEGAELDVLAGAEETIKDSDSIKIICEAHEGNSEEVKRELASFGLEVEQLHVNPDWGLAYIVGMSPKSTHD